MEDRKQVINCFEEQLKNALNNTSGQFISINHDREIWELILKAIQDTKQALTTKSEKEQALEIIVKKEVNLTTFYYSTGSVETYNELIEIHIKPSAYEKCKLTQEEYELVSKVVKEMVENEKV